MEIVFQRGDRGLICKFPEDRGPWIVPGRRERHAAPPTVGHVVEVEITGTSQNGRLRFARVVEDITAKQQAVFARIEAAVASAGTFEDLAGKQWGTVTVNASVFPWCYGGHLWCLDEQGRPAVECLKLEGRWLVDDHGCYVGQAIFLPSIRPDAPIPLGRTEEAQHVLACELVGMARRHSQVKVPSWAEAFMEELTELAEAVELLEDRTRKDWCPAPERFPGGADRTSSMAFWLLKEAMRVGAFELRELIDRIVVPVDEVTAQLADLLPGKPAHVRLSDGRDHKISWTSGQGRIWVEPSAFRKLELDPADSRVHGMRRAGSRLVLETSWEIREDLDGYSAGQMDELIGRGQDARVLI